MVEQVDAFLDEDVDEFRIEVGEVERFVRIVRGRHRVGEHLRDGGFGFGRDFGFGFDFGFRDFAARASAAASLRSRTPSRASAAACSRARRSASYSASRLRLRPLRRDARLRRVRLRRVRLRRVRLRRVRLRRVRLRRVRLRRVRLRHVRLRARSASARSASARSASARSASARSASRRSASTRSASTRSASARSASTRSASSAFGFGAFGFDALGFDALGFEALGFEQRGFEAGLRVDRGGVECIAGFQRDRVDRAVAERGFLVEGDEFVGASALRRHRRRGRSPSMPMSSRTISSIVVVAAVDRCVDRQAGVDRDLVGEVEERRQVFDRQRFHRGCRRLLPATAGRHRSARRRRDRCTR